MSQLKSELITRQKPVGGFTGVGTKMANDGDEIFIIAANGEILLSQIQKLMPDAEVNGETFIPVTIIQAT
jgi:hypothetical protein